VWPALAQECGLEFVPVDDSASFARFRSAIHVVSAGGVEQALVAAVRRSAAEPIAVGALADHRLALDAVHAGAAEYFVLPSELHLLRAWLRDHAERLRASWTDSEFVAREQAKYRFEGIFGESRALREALEQAALIIPHSNVTVLLVGETGTGKELFARAIHYNGPRRDAPFVDVNCAAIPDQLLESELFGYEKGAFTDATSDKPGLFEVAEGGTIFLDEIGHLPLALQGKLLRVIEERTVRRLGATRARPVDVRLIAATHVDLAGEVRLRRFRQDLFYRLDVVTVYLPPLRERREDIVPLARYFLAKFAAEYHLPPAWLTHAAERALLLRPWPGNVRELRNAMERAILLARGGALGADSFQSDVSRGLPGHSNPHLPFPATVSEITRAAAAEMLTLCDGNRSEAARRLGVSRSRLRRLLASSAHRSLGAERAD